MDFIDQIGELSSRVSKQKDRCTTEEATKNALVLPFIQALGYDVFNPTEVVPELTADIGTKKGEKVDYAILKDDVAIIIFECKRADTDLGVVHASQLYRYFSVLPDVKFGVLTNGVVYRFYSDLDAPNRMDDRPFFTFDILDYQERHVTELKKFTKSSFNLSQIRDNASELKYTAAITETITQEFDHPSQEFVVILTKRVYSGVVTKSVRDQFTEITRKALRRFLNDQISERLESALATTQLSEASTVAPEPQTTTEESVEDTEAAKVDRKGAIVTTEEEIESYFAVKSILRDETDLRRITMRDFKNHCSVLLDNSKKKPLCKMHFNRKQKYFELFDKGSPGDRVPIGQVDDIYNFDERLVKTLEMYDAQYDIPPKPTGHHEQAQGGKVSYTGTRVEAIVFQGEEHRVSTWRDSMFTFFDLLRRQDQTKFEMMGVTITGKKRPYITPSKDLLRTAQKIPGTNLYAETNLDSQSIVRICYRLNEKMGFTKDDLSFIAS